VIPQDFLHASLFVLIIAAGFLDAVGDSIKDLRTHMAAHPYRDFFHICKHLERAALVGVGLIWHPCMDWDKWATWITAAGGIVVGRYVWDAVYSCPWVWLRLDETVKVRTGIKWLDKWLGLHW
jgi:hypothetical protein